MTRSIGFASSLAQAALAAALLTGCAAPKDTLAPPLEAMAAPVEQSAPESPPETPTASLARLGLRGATVPAGETSAPATGRAGPDVGLSPSHAVAESRTSQAPTDESGLYDLLATVAAAKSPELSPMPAPVMAEAPPTPEPAVEAAEPAPMSYAAVAPTAPPAMKAPRPASMPAPTPVAVAEAVAPIAPEPAPITVAAAEPAPAPAAPPAVASVRAAPVEERGPQLEDFYRCDYAPVERRGGVQLVECQ
jgi:hypothetical protein